MKDMKLSTLKKVVVKCSTFWEEEVDVDGDIFDDVCMEAATRAIEKKKDDPEFKVAVILECFEKKNVKKANLHFCYNTYFVLVNAGLHTKAEMLRLNFMKLHQIDLQKESIKGKEEDDGAESNFELN